MLKGNRHTLCSCNWENNPARNFSSRSGSARTDFKNAHRQPILGHNPAVLNRNRGQHHASYFNHCRPDLCLIARWSTPLAPRGAFQSSSLRRSGMCEPQGHKSASLLRIQVVAKATGLESQVPARSRIMNPIRSRELEGEGKATEASGCGQMTGHGSNFRRESGKHDWFTRLVPGTE